MSHDYDCLPECIQAAFDERVDARLVDKAYKESAQPRYAAVSEQSGTKGIVKDMFQVEVTVPGHTQHLRLGRVNDTRMGCFLWCANYVDESLDTGAVMARFLDKVLHQEGFAEGWLQGVGARIPTLPPPGHTPSPDLVRVLPVDGVKPLAVPPSVVRQVAV